MRLVEGKWNAVFPREFLAEILWHFYGDIEIVGQLYVQVVLLSLLLPRYE